MKTCDSLLLSLAALAAISPAMAAPKTAPHPKPAVKPAPKTPGPKVAAGNTLATIFTAKGPIVLELYTKATPLTAGNFIKLARRGFYNGQSFHRVEPGFVIQAGDPYSRTPGDPRVGTGGPGYSIKMEPSALKFRHTAGALAMARTADPNSGGSQFYVTLGPAPFLDGQYAVFGRVLKGMDVAQRIRQWDKINRVTIGK